MGHSHTHHHTEFTHFALCKTKSSATAKCTCESLTYLGVALCAIGGFLVQYTLSRIADSSALAGDAWHTLFDGADSLVSLSVVFLIARTNLYESVIRKRGVWIAFALLLVAIGLVFYGAAVKLAIGDPIEPAKIIMGGTIGLVLGRIALYISERIPEELRSSTHHGQHIHVKTDFLISFSVVMVGIVTLFVHIPRLDGVVGIGIAGYLIRAFVPRFVTLLRT